MDRAGRTWDGPGVHWYSLSVMSTQWTNPPYEPSAGSQLGAGELAGFWRRLVALIIDGVILAIADGIVGWILGAIFGGGYVVSNGTVYASANGGAAFLIYVIQAIIFLGYFGYFWSARGQSLGYMALGLRVVRTDGSPLGFGRAVARAVGLAVSFWVWAIPAIISAFTVGLGSKKQALHDMVVDTQVVRT